ncbi:MAG: toluene monooxygenase [Alphaproteobacteria bacterium]|nr:toluene monooxygenase [Alphaproteobacteria bacterium]
MTTVPLCVNFESDFVLQLVPVESDFTMDQVAEAAAHHSLNRRVKPQPGRTLRVRLQDGDAPFDRDATVEQSGFQVMETIEVYYE